MMGSGNDNELGGRDCLAVFPVSGVLVFSGCLTADVKWSPMVLFRYSLFWIRSVDGALGAFSTFDADVSIATYQGQTNATDR